MDNIMSYVPHLIISVSAILAIKFLFGGQRKEDHKKDDPKHSVEKIENNIEPVTSIEDHIVAKVDDLKNGEMKEFSIKEGKILLVKENDEIRAMGNKCSHAGALLKNGSYNNGRVRCPWHGACFSTKTGDIEDFPAIDSIRTFPVRIEGNKVIVRADVKELTENWKRSPKTCSLDKQNKQVIALVGAGPATFLACQTLRSEGYEGRIIIIGKENHLSYDRTLLSKDLSSSVTKIQFRNEKWYSDNGVELILGNEVVELDPQLKKIVLRDNKEVIYDKALIATGSYPRTQSRTLSAEIPKGAKNIFFVRDLDCANQLASKYQNSKVAVIGSSFIAMETAAMLSKQAESITIVSTEKYPLNNIFGDEIGKSIKEWHDLKSKVKYDWKVGTSVVKFLLDGNHNLEGLELKNGEKIDCTVCVIGVGTIPSTKFLKQTGGVTILKDESIKVDSSLHAGNDLYAAGDVATYPYHISGKDTRVEHLGLAQYQGKVAALNMLNKKVECKSVPVVWTTQHGSTFRFCGISTGYDDIVVDGSLDPSNFRFAAFFCKEDKVIAVSSFFRDPVVAICANLMHEGDMLSKEDLLLEIKQGKLSLKGRLN